MLKRILVGLLPVLAVGLVLLGVSAVGYATHDWLRQQERASIAFGDLDCSSPPGMQRELFMLEVQSLGGLPDRLPLLDHDLAGRLAGAFGRHPWVERVERVAVVSPRRVEVRLTYRTPALAVGFAPPSEDAHAAFRRNSLPNRLVGSLGMVIGTISPVSRRMAS